MHQNRHRSKCARLLMFVSIAQVAAQVPHGGYEVHRLEKAYKQLRGRDSTCSAGWLLCPASAGGDCCPENYACASTYCYATTAGPTTACGLAGYYNCGIDSGAGVCCPSGYICGENAFCTPPAGLSVTVTCPQSYYACPASLNYGCCQSGMACGVNTCFSTQLRSYTVTSEVTTTDSAGSTITSVVTGTTVITPTLSLDGYSAGAVPKYVESTVSKVPAIETNSSSSGGGGGLSQGALGGIIGGVIAIILAILIAAFLIIRRLRKTARILQESSSAGEQTQAEHKQGFGPPTLTEVGTQDLESRTQTPSIRPSHIHLRAHSDSSVDLRHPSPARSPGMSSGETTPPAWPGHYNPVPSSDEDHSYSIINSITDGFYEGSRFPTGQVGRPSSESQTTYTTHQRQWSDASEMSGSFDGAHGLSELDSTADTASVSRRRSSGATRPPLAHVRRSSDPQRGRSDSSGVPAASPPLGTVSEISELHGYYGPVDRQTGQTAAWSHPQPSQTDPGT